MTAALIVVEQRVERVPAALKEVLGLRRVVMLPATARVAEQGARVTGQRRPASLEAQPADVDRHPVVLALFELVGCGRRQRRRLGHLRLVAGVVVARRCRRRVNVGRNDVAYDDVTRWRHLAEAHAV